MQTPIAKEHSQIHGQYIGQAIAQALRASTDSPSGAN